MELLHGCAAALFHCSTHRAAVSSLTPRSARRPVPSHHEARGGTVPSLCPRRRLPGRSLKKNRTSDKLELTLSDMSEVLLFFLFVSLPAVPAPAEDAPALFRRALLAVRDAPGLFRRALLAVRDAPGLFRRALLAVRETLRRCPVCVS